MRETANEIWRVLEEHVDRPLRAMRLWGECTVEKEGSEVQCSEAQWHLGEEYIFQTRQGGIVHCEYNNNGRLGKFTRVLISVRTRKKIDIRSKLRVVIDFCVRLGKDFVKQVLYCERLTVRNVLQNGWSNIGINSSTMDVKRLVVYHAPVGLTVWLQRSTNDHREVDWTDGRMHFE